MSVTASPSQLVECPSCQKKLPLTQLNPHLDRCLSDEPTATSNGSWNGIFANKSSSSHSNGPAAGNGGSARGTPSFSSPSTTTPKRAVNVSASDPDAAASPASKRPRTTQPSFSSSTVIASSSSSQSAVPLPHAPSPIQRTVTSSRSRIDAAKPFAERMRPQSLEEYVGQSEIINGPLKMLLRQGRIPSMILWGPPGTGKTTLARLLAKTASGTASGSRSRTTHTEAPPPHRFVEISATNAGTADVKKIMDEALHRLQLTGQRTLLFIDEIQRFSRAQQDVFLPAVEKGLIVLVAATTENPSFRLQSALISRMRVFVLTKLSVNECCQVLRNALVRVKEEEQEATEEEEHTPQATTAIKAEVKLENGSTSVGNEDYKDSDEQAGVATAKTEEEHDSSRIAAHINEELIRWIANMADGDARTALGALELALSTTDPSLTTEENLSKLKLALKRTALQYDRTGDMHYDTISALHKSIRGSDADAALYWLARMVCSGDDPLFIARRLIVAASEDVDTLEALQMATATYQACQVVGLPECGENLAQCVVFLAESPKSTRSYRAWKKAKALVEGAYNHPVPLHIRNAPTKLMKDIGYGKEYRYEPRFAHPVFQEFFPPQLRGTRFLSPPPDDRDPVSSGDGTGEITAAESGEPESSLPGDAEEQKQFSGTDIIRAEERHLRRDDYHHRVMQTRMTSNAGVGPGSCQRIFELGARAVDLDLLEEWEREKNDGHEWDGRKRLMQQLAQLEAASQSKKTPPEGVEKESGS